MRLSASNTDTTLQATGKLEWAPPEDYRIQFEGLSSELYVGGVYVRLFLKNPGFPLREPKVFLEGLLKAYLTDIAAGNAGDRPLLLVCIPRSTLHAMLLL